MLFENIKNLCNERHISVNKLEKDLGLGRDTIAKWATSIPRADRLKAVADFFGVTVDELMEETT